MKALAAVLVLSLAACQRVPAPQKGGAAGTHLGGFRETATAAQTAATLVQGENPAAASSQTVERQETRQEAAPVAVVKITETPTPAGIVRVTEQFTAPAVLTHTLSEKTGTVLGTAQKDQGREIAASLAAMRPVQFAGIAFLVAALACVHPVVRTMVGGGKIVPAVAATLGVALVFGPQIFAGRETLALIAGLAVLLGVFLLVRLSHKEGLLDARRSPFIPPGPTPGP